MEPDGSKRFNVTHEEEQDLGRRGEEGAGAVPCAPTTLPLG